MRVAGRIAEWNDAKGFGFIVPDVGVERAFVHVSEFARGSRRPVVGDLVTFLPGQDAKGRRQASQVRHVDVGVSQARRMPRAAIGIAALVTVVGAAWAGLLPRWLAAAYLVLSAMAWSMYLADKSAAKRNTRRVPENTLQFCALLGGWPGALVAQAQFRHKTIKSSFQAVFWIAVVLNVAAVGWLAWSGTADAIARSIGR